MPAKLLKRPSGEQLSFASAASSKSARLSNDKSARLSNDKSARLSNDKSARLSNEQRPVRRGPNLVVAELLKTHAAALAELLAAVQDDPLFNNHHPYFDELGRLRFLLSAKLDPKKAAANLRSALALRQQFGLDEVRERIRGAPSRTWSTDAAWAAMEMHTILSETIIQPDPDGPIISLIKPAQLDQHRVADEITPAAFQAFVRTRNEAMYAVLDETTRRTGRLTRMVRIMNIEGLSIGGVSQKLSKASGNLSEQTQCLYPQLLVGMVGINVPRPLKFFYDAVIRRFVPAKVQEKVMIVDVRQPAELQQLADRHGISLDDVPRWFGGSAPADRLVPYLFEPDPTLAAARETAWRRAAEAGARPQQVYDAVMAAVGAAGEGQAAA